MLIEKFLSGARDLRLRANPRQGTRREGVVITVHDNARVGGFGGYCLVAENEQAVR